MSHQALKCFAGHARAEVERTGCMAQIVGFEGETVFQAVELQSIIPALDGQAAARDGGEYWRGVFPFWRSVAGEIVKGGGGARRKRDDARPPGFCHWRGDADRKRGKVEISWYQLEGFTGADGCVKGKEHEGIVTQADPRLTVWHCKKLFHLCGVDVAEFPGIRAALDVPERVRCWRLYALIDAPMPKRTEVNQAQIVRGRGNVRLCDPVHEAVAHGRWVIPCGGVGGEELPDKMPVVGAGSRRCAGGGLGVQKGEKRGGAVCYGLEWSKFDDLCYSHLLGILSISLCLQM